MRGGGASRPGHSTGPRASEAGECVPVPSRDATRRREASRARAAGRATNNKQKTSLLPLARARARKTPTAVAADVLASAQGDPQPPLKERTAAKRPRWPHTATGIASIFLNRLFFLGEEVVDDRVEEDTTNADAAAKELSRRCRRGQREGGVGARARVVACVIVRERAYGGGWMDVRSCRLQGCRVAGRLQTGDPP